jgi:hypothetical protein
MPIIEPTPFEVEYNGEKIKVVKLSEHEESVAGLKFTNSQLKSEKTAEQEKLNEVQAKLQAEEEAKRQAEEEAARKAGDYEKLNRLMEERQGEEKQKYQQLLSDIGKEKTNGALNDLVTRHGAGGEYNEDLRDLLKVRFEFDYDHETKAVKVSGDSVSSIEELEQKLKSDARYARYLAGSKASGGGSTGSTGAGASTKNPKDMNEAERLQLKRDNPEAFRKAFLS